MRNQESVQPKSVLMFMFLLISYEIEQLFLLNVKWSGYFICGSWCLEIILSVPANVMSSSHFLYELFVLTLSNSSQ